MDISTPSHDATVRGDILGGVAQVKNTSNMVSLDIHNGEMKNGTQNHGHSDSYTNLSSLSNVTNDNNGVGDTVGIADTLRSSTRTTTSSLTIDPFNSNSSGNNNPTVSNTSIAYSPDQNNSTSTSNARNSHNANAGAGAVTASDNTRAAKKISRNALPPAALREIYITQTMDDDKLPALASVPRMTSRHGGTRHEIDIDYSQLDNSGDFMDDGIDDPDLCQSGFEHTGRWTRREHELFLEALKKYGKEWKKVASAVKTRTVVQTRK